MDGVSRSEHGVCEAADVADELERVAVFQR